MGNMLTHFFSVQTEPARKGCGAGIRINRYDFQIALAIELEQRVVRGKPIMFASADRFNAKRFARPLATLVERSGGNDNVVELRAGGCKDGAHNVSESSQIVTGPSLTSETFMSAPKTPVGTDLPRRDASFLTKRSNAGAACSGLAASV